MPTIATMRDLVSALEEYDRLKTDAEESREEYEAEKHKKYSLANSGTNANRTTPDKWAKEQNRRATFAYNQARAAERALEEFLDQPINGDDE